jgi:HlyD family secretion protein
MKRFIIPLLIVVVAVGGYFGYQQYKKIQSASTSAWQTAEIKRGSITAYVGATGTVRTNQSTVLTWQTSGRIASISVTVDSIVSAGQLLATLDKSTLSQSVILAEADLITAKRNLDNLNASNVTKSQAQLALAQAEKALIDALDARNSKDYKRAGQDIIDAARANLIIAQKAVDDAETLFDQFVDRSEDDILRAQSLSQLSAARQNRDRAQANLNYLLTAPDAQEISESDAKVAVAKAQLADAQREWERLQNGADPEDIQAAQARIDSILVTLDTVNINAPFGGTITQINSMVGDEVNPGTISFRLDDMTHLLVDVEVTEIDINRIKIGQSSTLSFDAINGKEYKGNVTEVARIGSSVQGVVNFTVTIELINVDSDVKPGMTAAVNILVNQIDNVVLVPNRGVRLLNGERVVYMLQNNVPSAVTIQIGSSSDIYSEIISDNVKEGDLIVLNPPVQMQMGPGGGGSPFGN